MKFRALALILLLALTACTKEETFEVNEKEKITDFIMEVNNGGFNQYFFNSAGDDAVSTLEILKRIEALASAKLLEDAISRFPNSTVPKEREIRQEILEEIDPDEELFEDLDSTVWSLAEDPESLYDLYQNKH